MGSDPYLQQLYFGCNIAINCEQRNIVADNQMGHRTGQYRVRCRALNSYSTAYYSDKVVTVFDPANNPCDYGKVAISPNPVKQGDGEIIVNIIDPLDPPPCNGGEFDGKAAAVTISEIEIYDLYANLVYTGKKQLEKSVKISNLALKKGYYVLRAVLSSGQIKVENFVVQ